MPLTIINVTTKGTVRRAKHEGRDYLVAPVIPLVEGVHAGSQGPALYLSEEIGRYPQSWNGIPLPVKHPTDLEGIPISCNSPDIIDTQSVGRFFNATFENGKLKGELWVDIEKAKKVAPEVLYSLENGRPLEVSTGLWSDDEPESGVWNDEQYQAIVRNIRPDHLALLPNGTGACSWADGCGAPRVNTKRGDKPVTDEKKALTIEQTEELIALANGLQALKTIRGDELKPPKQGGENPMEEKVQALIDNEQTPFEDSDKEWMLKLNECQLKKLEPKVNAEPEPEPEKEPEKEPEPEPVVNEEPEEPKKLTLNDILEHAEPEAKEQWEIGMKMLREKKAAVIKELVANKANPFTECELKEKKLDELEKLAALGRVKVDFTANGGEVKPKANDRYADPMPEMNFKKE